MACFNETADALRALENGLLEPQHIRCVITSTMERGGRRERGLLNGLHMLDKIKSIYQQVGIERLPIFAVISATADLEQCQQQGVDIVTSGSFLKLQELVIDRLKQRQCRLILIGIAGPSRCGQSTYAKHLAAKLRSPFQPIILDKFFLKPIRIQHPTLGDLESLEQPEAIDIGTFTALLRQLKTDWTRARWPRSASIPGNNDPIYVVVEGFLLFALSNEITSMCDIRLFLDSSQDRCRMQRFRRSRKISPDIPDTEVMISTAFARWFDQLVWSEYVKRRDQQTASAEKIFLAEEYENRNYEKLDAYIDKRLSTFV